MNNSIDWNELFKKYYLDGVNPDDDRLKKGIVFIDDVIDMDSSYVTELMWCEGKGISPIKIFISSPGGSVFTGLDIFDTIKNLKSETITIGSGQVASMAGILLQAGKKRLVTKNCWLMIHEVSSIAMGKSSDIQDEAKLVTRLQEQLLDILSERSKLTKTEIKRKWKRKDWWLSSDEILDLGLADGLYKGQE